MLRLDVPRLSEMLFAAKRVSEEFLSSGNDLFQ